MPNRPTTCKVLTLVATWALLLCHGIFGVVHLVPDPVPHSNPHGEHAAPHHLSGPPGESPVARHADSEYFAVLLGTFLGSLTLWLLLRSDRLRDGIFSALRLAGSPRATFSLPRAPTLPFLQVLRL